MITFKPLRTRRHTIEFKELSIAQIVELLTMPSQLNEQGTTRFISFTTGQDSSGWTVQERMLAVAHYIGHVGTDKGNFVVAQLGEQAWRLSDYWAGEDYPTKDRLELGEVAGDNWILQPLTGKAACAIEELQGTIPGIEGYLFWQIGMMAAQLTRQDEDPAPEDNTYDEWLQSRIKVFSQYPESDFLDLWEAFNTQTEKLDHFFKVTADSEGLAVKGVGDAPPARFRSASAVSQISKNLCG